MNLEETMNILNTLKLLQDSFPSFKITYESTPEFGREKGKYKVERSVNRPNGSFLCWIRATLRQNKDGSWTAGEENLVAKGQDPVDTLNNFIRVQAEAAEEALRQAQRTFVALNEIATALAPPVPEPTPEPKPEPKPVEYDTYCRQRVGCSCPDCCLSNTSRRDPRD